MSSRSDTDYFQDLFVEDIPMMDVRAPVEFAKGAFPNTVNVPLLDDSQREQVGKTYKDAGQDEAIQLGLKLVSADIKEQRLRDWQAFTRQHPDGYLYCFRGGLRSRTTQAWLKEQGVHYPLIKGGYKAMRQYLLDALALSTRQIPLVILSGLTGSGKTHVLKKITHQIDLEGLANHRGSAFGHDVNDYQPTQINFENALSIALLKHRYFKPEASLMLEDEGKLIGRVYLPPDFYQKMVQAPRVFLECSLQDRVRMTSRDYFGDAWPIYQQQHGELAEDRFSAFVLGNLERIQKRLGGERYQKVQAIFSAALQQLFAGEGSDGFDAGVNILLQEYYDPMYRYQLSKKPQTVIFKGSETEIIEWAESHLSDHSHEKAVSAATR